LLFYLIVLRMKFSENNQEKKKGLVRQKEKKTFRLSGQIIENLPSVHFKVRLENGKEIIAHLAGRLRLNQIRILPGDKVTVEMNSLEDERGRIIYRG
jgi:translation initiation factor IF-1